MKLLHFLGTLFICTLSLLAVAQKSLSIDKVTSIRLQNTGAIIQNEQVKGYFLFYMTDKIDRKTNEYVLQILDENLNKVKEIKLQDDKNVSLLEAAYNETALSFLFYNKDEKTLETKIFDLNGKQKFVYSKVIDKKTEAFLSGYTSMDKSDDYENSKIFSIKNKGFLFVLPVRDGRDYSYEVNYYSSEKRLQWTYTPQDEERVATATYLGNSDSIVVLEVTKRARLMGGNVTSSVIGLNFEKKQKAFELDGNRGKYDFVPQYCTGLKNTSNLLFVGPYFDKDDNIAKRYSQGQAIYIVSSSGKIISSTYNSWAVNIAKYLSVNEKGKVDDIGYLYLHNLIQSADGNIYAIGEGYKRVADGVGIGLNALSALGGSVNAGGNTMLKITDMVFLKFDSSYKISGASIQTKNHNNFHTQYLDLNSQHAISVMAKMMGAFDYTFTTTNSDASNFSVYYIDKEKSKEFKGEVLHSVSYINSKVSTDNLALDSKATSMHVLPAKQGNVMILEYFKKDKKLNVRLEKMN